MDSGLFCFRVTFLFTPSLNYAKKCLSFVNGSVFVCLFFSLIRPGREWRAIARAHAHIRHILFSCAIIARLNFV